MINRKKVIIAGGLAGLLFLLTLGYFYPLGAALVVFAGGLYFFNRKNDKALASVFCVPVLGVGMAYAFGQMAEILLKNPQGLVPASWFTLDSLANPENLAARVGLVAGAVLGAALGVVNTRDGRSKENSPDRVHGLKVVRNAAKGTNRWASEADVAPMCEFGPPREQGVYPGGIVLGRLRGRVVRVIPGKAPKGKPGLAGHVAVFGGTGSGKTYSYVINNIISAVMDGQSVVVTDPKGELAATLAPWLESLGYEVRIFNLISPRHSHRWNPVAECRNDSETAEMAACFVNNAARDGSGYFVAKEVQLLETLAGLLQADFPDEQRHLRAAMSLTAWSVDALDERFRRAYEEGRLTPTIYERWRGAASANFDNAVSGLSAKLRILTTEPLAALMSEPELTLANIGRKKTALFCVLPVNGDGRVLKPILSTFYMFLFKRLYELAAGNEGKLPVPVRFVLDEFANIGAIPGFSEIISTARSLGIHIQFILQGKSQLTDVYGAQEAKNILSNCPTLFLLGTAPGDIETARFFSQLLGHAAVETISERRDMTIPVKHYFELPKKSMSISRRALMEPGEITGMDPLDCIALVQWCRPMFLRKVGWVDLPQARLIKEAGIVPIPEQIPARSLAVSVPVIPNEDEGGESQRPGRSGGLNGSGGGFDVGELFRQSQDGENNLQDESRRGNSGSGQEDDNPVMDLFRPGA
ncbi:VirD4-like conjugal transfer protein, CD1115 family [Desulfoscipio geothermicus]|uniref:Type IV secretion system protein VirD4 n=1 Tax=Desulfoscipio geothermicus DSM 3669 TaxID=1121426 RepID=A0A1I6E4F9_9FIRM|nr:type IV secretory system conjugative DNA transfer family protein [Desulfoscipio geothermicus]SFR12527.1 type IV secretion system protein VirD4 [Desulfoscipio geothermicus DSM 3669]